MLKRFSLLALCLSLGLSSMAKAETPQASDQIISEQQVKAFIDAADKLPEEETAILKQVLVEKDEAQILEFISTMSIENRGLVVAMGLVFAYVIAEKLYNCICTEELLKFFEKITNNRTIY